MMGWDGFSNVFLYKNMIYRPISILYYIDQNFKSVFEKIMKSMNTM